MSVIILGIESSCDDTSAAVIKDNILLSNIIANQNVHKSYGGVVPELASRAHQQNIIPVVDEAIRSANLSRDDIDAVAFTRGPGLLGSLLVGTSFVKGFALAQNIKMIEVNHLQAHILVHFLQQSDSVSSMPDFPFLCLLVSGGHTQLVLVKDFLDMEIIGSTIDDAAGEAFDKCAKLMGLPYPGGPHVDKLAKKGDAWRFNFNKPKIDDYNYSFSGLKTSFLYFLRDQLKKDDQFIDNNRADLAASLQRTIIDILLQKFIMAAKDYKVKHIALAGGVSANSGLREAVLKTFDKSGYSTYIPEFSFTTDNAAMIAITGLYKYYKGQFADQDVTPLARMHF
ncbi:MAG TPA: tRNA (adenosine(37)-N6)-threonylcarbamoyltransferase complex transferase subunit TsaD [Bacteroidales bacterium]|nr:tRNA (adenosine(37)-N6)-threonylcarbamoyltransferase complex transferase subunit TsaD [Bacteroidales bacterium]